MTTERKEKRRERGSEEDRVARELLFLKAVREGQLTPDFEKGIVWGPYGRLIGNSNKSDTYGSVSIRIDGEVHKTSTHRFMWIAHTKEPIPEGWSVSLRNGDRRDVRIDNLELIHDSKLRLRGGKSAARHREALRNGRLVSSSQAVHGSLHADLPARPFSPSNNRLFSEGAVRKLREFYAGTQGTKVSVQAMADALAVTSKTMHQLLSGDSYRDIVTDYDDACRFILGLVAKRQRKPAITHLEFGSARLSPEVKAQLEREREEQEQETVSEERA